MIKLKPFIRMDQNLSIIEAYSQMKRENASLAILSHHDVIDVGFVSAKEVTRYLGDKYIPELEKTDK